jgi:Mg-chelatase subunit ChlI
MERRSKEKDSENSRSDISIVDAIKKLAAHNARADLDTDEQLLLFLQSWWSRTYNRPLKDPVLMSYSIEELLYEFYDRIERTKAEQERLEQDSVKIEEDKDKAAEDWAEQMERQEREAELRDQAGKSEQPIKDPTKDPANIAWMEEQIQKGKEEFGESFGEDIDEGFDE